MFLNNKAQTFGLKVVITTVVLILASGFWIQLSANQLNTVIDATETEACRNTLRLQRFNENFNVDIIRNTCKTLPPKELPEDARSTKELMSEFSDYIIRTWMIVDNGNIKDLWQESGFAGTGSSCLVMYILNFEQRNGFSEPISASRLQTFFSEEQLRLEKPGSDRNWYYEEYIRESGGLGRVEIMPPLEQITGDESAAIDRPNIVPGEQYAVSVMSPYASWVNRKFGDDASDEATIVIFSSLDFATNQAGCVVNVGANA